MKKIQTFAASVALTLMLAASCFADDGVMTTGSPAPTPTPPAASTTGTAPSGTDGVMTTGAPASDKDTTLTEIASALLLSTAALF